MRNASRPNGVSGQAPAAPNKPTTQMGAVNGLCGVAIAKANPSRALLKRLGPPRNDQPAEALPDYVYSARRHVRNQYHFTGNCRGIYG